MKFTSPEKITAECLPVMRSGSTNGRTLKGKVLPFFSAMKTFEAYDFQKFTIVDLKNKTIGILMTRPDMVWAQPIDTEGEHLPHIMIDRKSCAKINQWISEDREISVSFSVTTKQKKSRITNILASKESKPQGLILSAHYDSFFNTVGAHDNASGAIALLGVSELLKENSDINPAICFFDAEEWNKFGAYSFVKNQKEKGSLSNIKLQINLDSVGVPDYIYMLTNPSIEKTVSRLAAPLSKKYGLKISVSSKDAFPQFDTWPFMREGVNVIQIGSRSDAAPFKHWHSKKDSLKNIDYDFINNVVNCLSEFAVSISSSAIFKGKK